MVNGLTGTDAAGISFDAVERQITVDGRELLRMVAQHVMDGRAAREERLAAVTDAQGVRRTRCEPGHARTVASSLGHVRVTRMAYRAPGTAALHPADVVLDLPPRRQSWQVQRTVAGYVLAGSYEQARRFLLEATGVKAGKLQIEQIVADAVADAPGFYGPPDQDCGPDESRGGDGDVPPDEEGQGRIGWRGRRW